MEQELKNLVQTEGLGEKVFFIPHVPYKKLFEYIASSNLGICLLEDINLSKKYTSNNKVSECFAASVPVLMTDSVELQHIVKGIDATYMLKEFTPESLGRLINALLRNPKELQQKGKVGREAFEQRLNWQAQQHIFKKALNQLIIN